MPNRRREAGEGSIYPVTRVLKNGTETTHWKASVRHQGKRYTLSSTTRSETARRLKMLLRELEDNGVAAQGKKPTLAQFCEEWLASSVKPTTRPRTYQAYEERLRLHILPTLGRLKLHEVTAQHLQRLYARKLEKGLSSGSLNGIHVVLHRALKQAVRWGLIPRNPTDGVDVPQPRPPDGKPLDADELAVFLEGVVGDERETLWMTLLLTGLRFGELAALRWGDIDLEQRVLHVRFTITREGSKGYAFTEPKTTKSRRVVPLPSAAVVALRTQQGVCDRQRQDDWPVPDLVFPSGRGTPLREPHVLDDFHALLDRVGLPRRRLHDLRGTYATRLFALNNHPRAVQELLGHTSIATTLNIYTGSVPEVLREAADSLDRAVERPAGTKPAGSHLRVVGSHAGSHGAS